MTQGEQCPEVTTYAELGPDEGLVSLDGRVRGIVSQEWTSNSESHEFRRVHHTQGSTVSSRHFSRTSPRFLEILGVPGPDQLPHSTSRVIASEFYVPAFFVRQPVPGVLLEEVAIFQACYFAASLRWLAPVAPLDEW
jgi:hypothetical protein